jgi:hypothetical protein
MSVSLCPSLSASLSLSLFLGLSVSLSLCLWAPRTAYPTESRPGALRSFPGSRAPSLEYAKLLPCTPVDTVVSTAPSLHRVTVRCVHNYSEMFSLEILNLYWDSLLVADFS